MARSSLFSSPLVTSRFEAIQTIAAPCIYGLGVMKKTQKQSSQISIDSERSLLMGSYAHQVIAEQFHRVIKHERRVLADKDPEYLHQMRVGTRRLRTALQVFGAAIVLPKGARTKRLSRLAKVLGKLRDLDVQIATLKHNYCPHLDNDGQEVMTSAIAYLEKQRRKAFAGTQDVLSGNEYKALKAAYERWLGAPQLTVMAQLPIMTVLPELLTPLLAHLLLHPAWQISTNPLSLEDSLLLHDLRKTFKHVRYQAEFFIDFYGQDFHGWVQELRALQDALGDVQDSQVLLELLMDEQPNAANLPEVRAIADDTQANALAQWNEARNKYLDPNFRRDLYRLILAPTLPPLPDPDQN